MFSKAAELESAYFKKTEEHVRRRVAGELSERAATIITHSLAKPLVLL